MKLQQLIGPERVFIQLEADDINTALAAVSERISPDLDISGREILGALLDRERLGSTSVGDGFAIPHCKLQGTKKIYLALARFVQGVDFGATDGEPVRFLFVVLSPPDQPAAHLQVLSQIARVLKRKDLRRDLLAARETAEIIQSIQKVAAAEGL